MEILDLKNRLNNVFFKKKKIEAFFLSSLTNFKIFSLREKRQNLKKLLPSNRKLMLLDRDGKERNNKSHPTPLLKKYCYPIKCRIP